MSELTAANIEQVIQACQANLPSIGESLNQCFGTAYQLSLGDSLPVSGLDDFPVLSGSGLVIAFEVGSAAVLCVISSELPLPAWTSRPDQSQTSKLETLAQEWSFHCLPDDLPGDNFVFRNAASLREYIAAASPDEAAECLPLLAASPNKSPAARIWLIWPVARIPAESEMAGPQRRSSPGAATAGDAFADGNPSQSPSPYTRLRNLPVPVIVKLAEKKIELGQLLAIGPGAIITFEKSCEDLLELYVNNHLYCRGEAVKIGEKFGLKICETGSVHSRASALAAMESRSE